MADDFNQERDVLTYRPNIQYEEPDVELFTDEPLDEQINTLEDARQATNDLSKSYSAVEKLAELAQKRVDDRVGNYVVNLDPKADALTIAAIKRAFPEAADPTKISFEMYKQCLSRANVPALPEITTADLLAAKKDPLKTDFSGYGMPAGMNRPEITNPAKIVEPLDMEEFQQDLLKQLFELLQSVGNIAYIEWRFKQHLLRHNHQS